MTDEDDAYKAAQRLIAEAKAKGTTYLDFDTDETRALTRLPPEIADLSALRVLLLRNTQITDLTPLTALPGLSELDLSNSQITYLEPLAALTDLNLLWLHHTQTSDLQPLTSLTALIKLSAYNTQISNLEPLVGLTKLTSLYLYNTQIVDLQPLRALKGLTTLSVRDTAILDLRPLRDLSALATYPDQVGLTFTDTPATRADPRIAEIAVIKDHATRARELFAYLETWVPPGEGVAPSLPDRIPAPLETEIRDNALAIAIAADPHLPPGPVNARARVGWQELRYFRADFEGALNIANYRPLAATIGAFDRAIGASYEEMNDVGVGLAGQRLAALANDTDFVATLPEGAGTELGTLATAIATFANRFPDWLAYLSDPDQSTPQAALASENLQIFDSIARSLEQADDVETAVIAEYRDEVELLRSAPQSEVAARAVLASTRDLLRTLSENLLIGFRRYLDDRKRTARTAATGNARFVGNQAKEFAKMIPGEIRKASFWAIVGITSDLLFNKGGLMMSLATRFPDAFGWLATVLRYFGLVP